ncbi:CatB-related O-acetyltransferase [Clostridium sp. AL.422]|uniref:CatB-related O-acetyltransferase n=1 Tax=Clostridium TaxID=1485 RepID=UPI00293DB92C|nr:MULTISPECIES: CatB-related O-acetyltransferase [unclassified Clostridium]MDV4150305.1 CatB-related O-acetyltransferase [Clostridium sp. AL.422]
MKKFIKGIFKYNLKSLMRIRKNISIFSLIDVRSEISKKAAVARGCKLSNVTMGDYSYISKKSDISNCQIGKFCSIAPGVKIGFGMHPTNLISTSPLFYTDKNVFKYAIKKDKSFIEHKKTIIGNDVWIGLNSIILDGIKIGDGAIVAAGAVVTKDIPPYAVVGGVPAKIIKYRFDEEKRKELTKFNWWNLEEDKIREFINKNEEIFGGYNISD